MSFLERALVIETRLGRHENRADTHLNVCAVLSQLGRHDLARVHSQSAIIIAQQWLIRAFLPKIDSRQRRKSQGNVKEIEKSFKDRIAILAIAYHNLAVELEFLRELDDAL